VGTGAELKALAHSIIDSYEMRVRTVHGLMEQAYRLLKTFQTELEEMIIRLRDNLSRAESLRKADFDRMMGGLINRQRIQETQVEEILSCFEKEEMEMIDRLRKIIVSGGHSNLEDMNTIRDDILKRQKERETGLIQALKRIQVEQEELKAAIKCLLNKGEGVRIRDFKLMLKSLGIQQADRDNQLNRMLEDLDLARNKVQSQWHAVVSRH
jgi:hypothetical protein